MVVNDIQHKLQYCADQKLDKSYDRKLQESTHLNYDNHYKLLGIQIPGDLDLLHCYNHPNGNQRIGQVN